LQRLSLVGLEAIILTGFIKLERRLPWNQSLLNKSARAAAQKIAERGHGPCAKVRFENRQDFVPPQSIAVNDAIRCFKLQHVLSCEAASPESNQIEAYHLRMSHGDIGWHILRDLCHGTDHRQASDPAMLNDGGRSTQVGAVVELHEAAQQDMVHQDATASDLAVMPHVGTDHQKVVVLDDRRCVVGPAAVNGHILADTIMVADRERAARIMDLKVLGFATNNGPFTNAVVATERRSRSDDGSGFQRTAVAEDCSLFNNAKGTDRDVVAQFCTLINESRGMNLSHECFHPRLWDRCVLVRRKCRRFGVSKQYETRAQRAESEKSRRLLQRRQLGWRTPGDQGVAAVHRFGNGIEALLTVRTVTGRSASAPQLPGHRHSVTMSPSR
jgi:hypothetical protein